MDLTTHFQIKLDLADQIEIKNFKMIAKIKSDLKVGDEIITIDQAWSAVIRFDQDRSA